MEYINGINKRTYDLLFDDKIIDEVTDEEYEIGKKVYELDTYTLFIKKNILVKNKLKKFYQDIEDVNINYDNIKFDKSDNSYIFIDNGQEIRFNLLSDRLKDQKELYKDLCSDERKTNTMFKNMSLCLSLRNSILISGIFNFMGNKHLYSIIEIKINNEVYILDYSKNIIMKKDDYYKLFDFTPIAKLYSYNLESDINYLDFDLDTLTLLFFRDELLKATEKNKKIFDKNLKLKRS